MSRLSVFWPEETNSKTITAEAPVLLPFPQRSSLKAPERGSDMDVVTRARLLFSNRHCHDCGYPVVEPIELSDSLTNHSGLSIPGTATLVGFRCCGCEVEWSI